MHFKRNALGKFDLLMFITASNLLNNLKKLILTGVSLLLADFCFGQTYTDTIQLHEIEITAHQSNYTSIARESLKIDLTSRTDAGKNLSEILINNSGLTLRTTSPGNLSTLSYRGNNSSQTVVLWNGFNINSSTTGQSDLSQIPSFFIDEAKNEINGNNHYSSSAGVIELSNHFSGKKYLKADLIQEAGSFKYLSTAGSIYYGTNRFSTQVKLISTSSANNYNFQNYSKSYINPPTETRQEAAYLRNGFLAEGTMVTGTHHYLEAKIYLIKGKNDIPQPVHIPVIENNENQSENHLKSLIKWSYENKKLKLAIMSGYSIDDLIYENAILKINSTITANNFNNRFVLNRQLTQRLTYDGIFDQSISLVNTNNYRDSKDRMIMELTNGLKYESGKIFFKTGLKLVMENKRIIPLPSFEVMAKPFKIKTLEFNASANKTYRFPSMNDLYWYPGGNPELENETGWTTETGVAIIPISKKTIELKLKVTKYFTKIRNQIVWQPDSLSGLWKPVNLNEQISDGWEPTIEFDSRFGKNHINWKTSVSTVNAHLQGTNPAKLSVTVFPAYIPAFEFHQIATYQYNQVSITLNSRFTGKRYTDLSNTTTLQPFWKHDLSFNYQFSAGIIKSTANLTFENITNSQYEYYAWYPMPGINFRIGLRFEFIKTP